MDRGVPDVETFRLARSRSVRERAPDVVAGIAALEELVRPDRETFLREPVGSDDPLDAVEG